MPLLKWARIPFVSTKYSFKQRHQAPREFPRRLSCLYPLQPGNAHATRRKVQKTHTSTRRAEHLPRFFHALTPSRFESLFTSVFILVYPYTIHARQAHTAPHKAPKKPGAPLSNSRRKESDAARVRQRSRNDAGTGADLLRHPRKISPFCAFCDFSKFFCRCSALFGAVLRIVAFLRILQRKVRPPVLFLTAFLRSSGLLYLVCKTLFCALLRRSAKP